jgi:N-acetylglutamate synthase
MRSAVDVRELEDVAYDLWRAPVVEELDGWRLRFAFEMTGRANSVWPNAEGTSPVGDKVGRAERWYAERGSRARFQMTPAAEPGLEDELVARGYTARSGPVSVETASLDDVLTGTGGEADLDEELDHAWLALWAGSRGFDRLDVARALLTGSPGETAFARVGEVAVGRGVLLGDWLGVTSMATMPSARRRGHGRAVLHALARWAADRDATRALLQVEEENVAARTLYAGAGFLPSHAYRYLFSP